MVSDLTFKTLIHFELIFVYDVRQLFSFIAYDCPVFPRQFIEKTILSTFHILASFVVN